MYKSNIPLVSTDNSCKLAGIFSSYTNLYIIEYTVIVDPCILNSFELCYLLIQSKRNPLAKYRFDYRFAKSIIDFQVNIQGPQLAFRRLFYSFY